VVQINVAFERSDIPVQDHIELRVSESPEGEVFATWLRVNDAADGAVTVHVTQDSKPVAGAWEDATDYAQANKLLWIYVDDPAGVFPADELGLVEA
jgi:hypothetical protein